MEFIKQNWSKILLAAISFVGFILILVPLFTAPEFNFIGFSQIFGIALFFLGITVYYIVKALSKDKKDTLALSAKYIVLATGVLSLLFMFIGALGINSKVTTDLEAYAKAETQQEYKDARKSGTQGVFGGAYLAAISMGYQGIGSGSLNSIEYLLAAAKDGEAKGAVLKAIKEKYEIAEPAEGAKIQVEHYSTYITNQLAMIKEVRTLVAGLESASSNAETIAAFEKSKESALETIDEGIKNLKSVITIKNGIIVSYLCMMLVFGLFPIVKGAKGLVCHYCGCCCGGKREEKVAPAPAAPAEK